jgi:hypothetical protein
MCRRPKRVPTARVVPCDEDQKDGERVMHGRTNLLDPGNRADSVASLGEIAQLGYLGIVGGPEIHAGAETDAEDIGARPIDEV